LPALHEVLAGWLRRQAGLCASLGSPFYSSLLESAAGDDTGVTGETLAGFENETESTVVPLRLMGAVHRLVLEGRVPTLEPHYPSVGGDGDAAAAWPAFREALGDHRPEIRRLVAHGCQTNEVGRSAALLGGFLEVARRSGLPLRILEIGASAGLNLRWDHYRYESGRSGEPGEAGWGDESSAVRFVHFFDVPPSFNRAAEVVERQGCDLEPIDPTTDEGALALRSFIWADQLGRLSRLDGAITIAKEVPATVERLDAAAFLERELAVPRHGMATVVFHSAFMKYVNDDQGTRIRRALDEASVYYLRLEPDQSYLSSEPDQGTFEIRLGDELLGTSQAHGAGVRWF
jgi:hypothetical protein